MRGWLQAGCLRGRLLLGGLLAVLDVACGPAHIGPHRVRHREVNSGAYERTPKRVSRGSLWLDTSRSLVADFRAGQVGDLVTILVDENPAAAGDAATGMDRSSDMSLGFGKIFGFAEALSDKYPNVDPAELISLMSEASFSGTGNTSRGSQVSASISARVREQMPNGDLFIEGTKVLMVNDEELHIYVSGVVRPQDIGQDNSVDSGRIADAQIEFTGRGSLTDNQRQGWLARLISAINPF